VESVSPMALDSARMTSNLKGILGGPDLGDYYMFLELLYVVYKTPKKKKREVLKMRQDPRMKLNEVLLLVTTFSA
jgi:hypothetical protein